ncbi:MAG: hypothetical protein ACQEP5_04545, partial [Actinomycetota bacterium]
MPDIKNVEVNSETTMLVYFSNGIIKIFDLKPFLPDISNTPTDIKLSPQGATLNDNVNISEYDLWARSKFYGWDR